MSDQLREVADVTEGMALEDALFLGETAGAVVWQASARALVAPRAYRTRTGFDAAARASAARGWPVFLRPTGGGIVPQGRGVVNLAISFRPPRNYSIEDAYKLLTGAIRDGLGTPGQTLVPGDTPGSFCDGDWNLSFGGRKIVGTAQKWRPVRGDRPRVLAHAMILNTGDVTPGARAVSALHRDIGLTPVDPGVHTTLDAAFGPAGYELTHLHQTAEAAAKSISLAKD